MSSIMTVNQMFNYFYDNFSYNLLSPFMYMLFVKSFDYIQPCPKSETMKICRFYHNIGLAIASLIMFIITIYGSQQSNKFESLDALICHPYNNNGFTIFDKHYSWVLIGTTMFLYSKYWEWLDTLFLHLSGKPISTLQYSHHMTTGFGCTVGSLLGFTNGYGTISMGLNCFIHIPMYWYFAYPRGMMKPFRKFITQIQILQHILCIGATVYAIMRENCTINPYSNEIILGMYVMYLFYFSMFYISSYSKQKNN